MKAEPDGTVKASIRQARQVYLVQQKYKNPIILLCEVNKPTTEQTYTTRNAKVGAAAKLIGVNGDEQSEESEDITTECQFRLWNYRIADEQQDILFKIVREQNT